MPPQPLTLTPIQAVPDRGTVRRGDVPRALLPRPTSQPRRVLLPEGDRQGLALFGLWLQVGPWEYYDQRGAACRMWNGNVSTRISIGPTATTRASRRGSTGRSQLPMPSRQPMAPYRPPWGRRGQLGRSVTGCSVGSRTRPRTSYSNGVLCAVLPRPTSAPRRVPLPVARCLGAGVRGRWWGVVPGRV